MAYRFIDFAYRIIPIVLLVYLEDGVLKKLDLHGMGYEC